MARALGLWEWDFSHLLACISQGSRRHLKWWPDMSRHASQRRPRRRPRVAEKKHGASPPRLLSRASKGCRTGSHRGYLRVVLQNYLPGNCNTSHTYLGTQTVSSLRHSLVRSFVGSTRSFCISLLAPTSRKRCICVRFSLVERDLQTRRLQHIGLISMYRHRLGKNQDSDRQNWDRSRLEISRCRLRHSLSSQS